MLLEIDGLKLERSNPEGRCRSDPILFVHGMWGGFWYWQDCLRFFFSRGYVCFAINLRGHHGSRPVPDIGKTSLRDYVEDIYDAARSLGGPILMGHSREGLLVLEAAELLSPPVVVDVIPAFPLARCAP